MRGVADRWGSGQTAVPRRLAVHPQLRASAPAGHRSVCQDQHPWEERKGHPTQRAEPSARSEGPSLWARGSRLPGRANGPRGAEATTPGGLSCVTVMI